MKNKFKFKIIFAKEFLFYFLHNPKTLLITITHLSAIK